MVDLTRPIVFVVLAALAWGGGFCSLAPAATQTGRRPGGSSAAASPAALIRDLYRLHNKGYGPIFDGKSRKHIERYFDRPLADLLSKNIIGPPSGEVGNLDFDPLFNAQDLSLSEFRIGEARIRRDMATSLVRFKNDGRKVRITFHLRKRATGWKITDLDYGGGETLVKILKKPF